MAISLNNLALLRYSQGAYEEAERFYRQAIEIDRNALGEDHPDFVIDLFNLGGLYVALGRFAEAEPLYFKTLAVFTDRLDEQHPKTQVAFNGLIQLIATAIQAN